MEGAQHEAKLLCKSHIMTRCSSVGDNGQTYTLTKHKTRASYQLGTDLSGSNIYDESKLRSRGIEIVETDTPSFEKVSPEQVADYYKSLGDWQNVLPKTDYTYSPVSRFYKKKINGVIPVIPNMSRREIHCSPEQLDNEINLFCAENYLYEETHANQLSSSAKRSSNTSSSGNSNSNARIAFYPDQQTFDMFNASPAQRSSVLNSTHSSAKLSRLRRSFLKSYQDEDYEYPSSRHYVTWFSLFSSAYSFIESFVLSISSAIYSLVSSVSSAMYLLFGTLIGALYSLKSSTTSAAYSLTQYTSSSFACHQSVNLSTSAHESTLRLSRSGAVFWKLFFVALLILFLCVSFRGFGTVNGDSNVSAITAPVSKSYSFVTHLVFSIYELTYSSIAFILSMISVAGVRARDTMFTVQFASLYQLLASVPLWWSSSNNDSTPIKASTTLSEPALSNADIEKLFKHWLATANSNELARKIMASDEFVRFIDDKLKRIQQDGDEKWREFTSAHNLLMLERRVSELETKFLQLEPVEDVSMKKFEQKITQLRVEIAQRERHLEKEVIVALAAVLGVGGEISTDELKSRFTVLFASIESAWREIEQIELQFVKFAKNASESFDAQFERTTRDLKHDLRLSVEEMVAKKLAEWKASAASGTIASTQAENLEEYVKGVVRKALEVYDADKTGLADYALESSGGIVLSTRCTETKTANAQFSIFGIPLWHTSRSPRTVIQPGVHPGECWPFPGSNGYLVIQLSERIFVTGVTLEHIPRSLAPNGTIDSAPKDFSVWALRSESDLEPQLLGEFRFEVDGPSLQYFETNRLLQPYQIVELKILSNHGKLDYTCLYRFRVHGVPA